MSLPLISPSDIVSNNELTVILEIIVQCDVTSFDLTERYCQYQRTDCDTGNHRSV
jgi:hypothetical protein